MGIQKSIALGGFQQGELTPLLSSPATTPPPTSPFLQPSSFPFLRDQEMTGTGFPAPGPRGLLQHPSRFEMEWLGNSVLSARTWESGFDGEASLRVGGRLLQGSAEDRRAGPSPHLAPIFSARNPPPPLPALGFAAQRPLDPQSRACLALHHGESKETPRGGRASEHVRESRAKASFFSPWIRSETWVGLVNKRPFSPGMAAKAGLGTRALAAALFPVSPLPPPSPDEIHTRF